MSERQAYGKTKTERTESMKKVIAAVVMALEMLTASVKADVTVPIPLNTMLQEVSMGAKIMHGTVAQDSTSADGSVSVVLRAPWSVRNGDFVMKVVAVVRMKLTGRGNKTSIQAVDARVYGPDGRYVRLDKKQLADWEKRYAQDLVNSR
jgi:hypothetical protein